MVLKPSDTTPVTTVMMAEMMAEFLPPGVMNVVCGDRDTGRALVGHEIPQLISITGSVRAGMQVAEQASQTLKRCHLELGGKAANIVFDDAPLDQAMEGIVNGIFDITDPNTGTRWDSLVVGNVGQVPALYDPTNPYLTDGNNTFREFAGAADQRDAKARGLQGERERTPHGPRAHDGDIMPGFRHRASGLRCRRSTHGSVPRARRRPDGGTPGR